MVKKISCIHCSKHHKSKARVLKCLHSLKKDGLASQQLTSAKQDVQMDDETQQLSLEIDKVYCQITQKKGQYYRFYNQYRRQGVSDETEYQSMEEKQDLKKDKESIKFIFKELMELQQFTKNKNKKQNQRKVSSVSNQQKLNRYLRQNADRIQTFEQLVCKSIFNDWQWQKKQAIVGSIDLLQSQARSRNRQMRGKDKQSIKAKYVAAWKILTDPLTRIMLSDQFLESWHDKIFPKFINPFKFRRLERQLKIERNYHQLAKKQLLQDQKYLTLCQKFNQLSQQLIELKVCPIPPSLQKNAEKLITVKQMTIQSIEQRIEEIQNDAESSELIVLPPQPKEKYPTYWEILDIKREKQRLQRVRQKKSALQHKKWVKHMVKTDKLTQNLTKFGGNLGFLVFSAEENKEDLKELLQINQQNQKLAESCYRKSIDIEDLEDLEFEENQSIRVLKKIRKQMMNRLHPKCLKQSPWEREIDTKRATELFKKMNALRQKSSTRTRTIY